MTDVTALSGRESAMARLLVAAQFALLGVWLLSGAALAVGQAIRLVQLAALLLAVWAMLVMTSAQKRLFRISPDPTGHRQLVREGPYRWIRHPMYAAILLLVAPPLLERADVSRLILLAALAAVLVAKLTLEERLLVRRFADYADYRRETWRLFPPVY
jgi:protein-S-isoprenylcysteine O-methyltransferase Ste14